MPFNFKTSPIKTKSGMTKYSITNFKANFFQLQYYIALNEHMWQVLDPFKDFQLDLNYDEFGSIFKQSGISLRKKYEVVHTIKEFG